MSYESETLEGEYAAMPIIGIGTDIIETARIQDKAEREQGFCTRLFTPRELAYCEGKVSKYQHLAGRFAAKEAIAKALGSSLSWQEVEILNDHAGKPRAKLYGKAAGLAGKATVHVSISHVKEYASAVAIVEET